MHYRSLKLILGLFWAYLLLIMVTYHHEDCSFLLTSSQCALEENFGGALGAHIASMMFIIFGRTIIPPLMLLPLLRNKSWTATIFSLGLIFSTSVCLFTAYQSTMSSYISEHHGIVSNVLQQYLPLSVIRLVTFAGIPVSIIAIFPRATIFIIKFLMQILLVLLIETKLWVKALSAITVSKNPANASQKMEPDLLYTIRPSTYYTVSSLQREMLGTKNLSPEDPKSLPEADPSYLTMVDTAAYPSQEIEYTPPASTYSTTALPLTSTSGKFPIEFPIDLFTNHEKDITTVTQDHSSIIATLEQALRNFDVEGKIVLYNEGPVVTLYEFEPAAGIKASKVIALADDIALAIKALSVRIAVIWGKNVIGIEIPNQVRQIVSLKSMLASDEYKHSSHDLPVAMGCTIGGVPNIIDLAKTPHLLVAGTTGSGKSVAINVILLSLLSRLTPSECKLILIDPKMLELSVYNGIPHLATPVVTDSKMAVATLRWVVHEMEERYSIMSKFAVRNIKGYNTRIQEMTVAERARSAESFKLPKIQELPFLVVVVDEMADLMLVAGKEIETLIQRLSQMARAAGIHLVMATQRPSVDVITGVIKANFPTRVAFAVTSRIDSRTILGEQGAEQLLGMGDMLLMVGGGKIERLHGPFVSDTEVKSAVEYLKAQGSSTFMFNPSSTVSVDNYQEKDDLYAKAIQILNTTDRISVSYIQRQLRIGYNRAATIIERMEAEGLISTPNGIGKREILNRSSKAKEETF